MWFGVFLKQNSFSVWKFVSKLVCFRGKREKVNVCCYFKVTQGFKVIGSKPVIYYQCAFIYLFIYFSIFVTVTACYKWFLFCRYRELEEKLDYLQKSSAQRDRTEALLKQKDKDCAQVSHVTSCHFYSESIKKSSTSYTFNSSKRSAKKLVCVFVAGQGLRGPESSGNFPARRTTGKTKLVGQKWAWTRTPGRQVSCYITCNRSIHRIMS